MEERVLLVCNSHEFYKLGDYEERIPDPLPPCAYCGNPMLMTWSKRAFELSAQPGQRGGESEV